MARRKSSSIRRVLKRGGTISSSKSRKTTPLTPRTRKLLKSVQVGGGIAKVTGNVTARGLFRLSKTAKRFVQHGPERPPAKEIRAFIKKFPEIFRKAKKSVGRMKRRKK